MRKIPAKATTIRKFGLFGDKRMFERELDSVILKLGCGKPYLRAFVAIDLSAGHLEKMNHFGIFDTSKRLFLRI